MTHRSGHPGAPTIAHEILSLTGIRAFAAIGVVLTHFHSELESFVPSFSLLAPLYSRGGLGVDLFFVLSGFIITHVYEDKLRLNPKQEYRKYIINRFARIYPNYFATLTTLVIMVLCAEALGFAVQGQYPWLCGCRHIISCCSRFPGCPGDGTILGGRSAQNPLPISSYFPCLSLSENV